MCQACESLWKWLDFEFDYHKCKHMFANLWGSLWCHFNLCVIPLNISWEDILAEMLEQQLKLERWRNNNRHNISATWGNPAHAPSTWTFALFIWVLSVHHPVNCNATIITMTSPEDFIALESFNQTCLKKRDSRIRKNIFWWWCCSESVAIYHQCPFKSYLNFYSLTDWEEILKVQIVINTLAQQSSQSPTLKAFSCI